ncbi:PAS domain S-box protein [Natronomonas sp. LN261]|uniref:hybrid sensor histidine kinase/response regulator n=1 Tax=Natronomonas sp. LN261 TaxID=2750669 RepID=UPI0015EF8CFC|nr:PAS domain S-box protein [Natronomonas sp. LN261]
MASGSNEVSRPERETETVRVLHVDDESGFAELAVEFLERIDDGLVVETAASASEGLDRLAEGDYDCIVSDYDMPERNGIEFLETVRQAYPRLPFILFTGKGSEAVASKAITAGASDYLQKGSDSVRYELLATRIRSHVERTRAQRVQRRHLKAIETADEGISILDSDGRFTYVNQRYADMYGYDPAEMIGEHWEVTYPEESIQFIREEIIPVVEASGSWQGETTGLHADGSTFTEDHRLAKTHEGGLVCTIQDVTDRKETQRRLEQFKLCVEHAGHAVYITDADGTIEYVNPAFERITGYAAETALGATPSIMKSGEMSEGYYGEMWRTLLAGTVWEESVVNRRKSGERYHAHQTVAPVLDGAGEPTAFIAIQADITDHMRRRRELERQRDRLDEFASVVSHDLRNPLNVAKGRLTLASEACASEHIDPAKRALDRMEALVEDVLTLARAGETIGDTEAVELSALGASCWRTIETAAARLVVETDATVHADRSRLHQLLENLLGNAIEHGGADVTVVIGDLPDGFYVEDDGPGIPDGERESVLEAGYSTADETLRIGLSIVQQIAEAHGWEVDVTDGSEGGARFEFRGVRLEG